MKTFAFIATLCAALCAPAHAAFVAHHAGSRLAFDGALTDPAWKQAPVFDNFFENLPQDKIAAKVRTEIKVVYDDSYFYVGMKAFDPSPEKISAPYSRRDKTKTDQDLLILMIDPTGSRKSAQFIRVNPRGSVSDGSFSDTAGEDFAPDFDFDVATGRFNGGWTAEVRIPFSSLAYTPGSTVPWNMLVLRNLMREQRYRLVNAPMPGDSGCFLCFAEPITNMGELPAKLNWSATPQLLLRSAGQRASGQSAQRENSYALSLDVKVRPTPDLAFDATVNPDFSQIELDAPQLSGNTRFGLFFEEKRPFFLEGADILVTPQRAISTRSINDPAWGARVTRRNAGSDLTLLSVLDNGGALVQLPGAYSTGFAPQDFRSQASIARANFRFNELSVGAVASDRTLRDGRGYNRVVGPDFVWQINDSARVDGQFLSSETTALPDAAGRLDAAPAQRGHAAYVSYDADYPGWGWRSSVQEISPRFRADNGFFAQAGFRDAFAELRYKFGRTGILHKLNLYGWAQRQDDSDGDAIVRAGGFGLWMHGPRDSYVNLQLKPADKVRVRKGGELLARARVSLSVEGTPNPVFGRVVANVELGDVVDVDASRVGKGGTAYLYSRIRPNDRIEIEPSYSLAITNDQSQRMYSERVFAFNGIYHFTESDTLRVILQNARTERNTRLYPTKVEAQSTGNTASLVFTHARSIGTALYVGLTLSNNEQKAARLGLRQNEFFVKGSWRI